MARLAAHAENLEGRKGMLCISPLGG
jgi:hypothetical protein